MTPEEINHTVEFLLNQSAQFSVHMDELRRGQAQFAARQERDHEALFRGLTALSKSTAQFQSSAAEVLAMESRRLDEHDKLHQESLALHRQALHLLHLILNRLPPGSH